MNEPELAPGDSGEWVLQLQTRLHALDLYAGAIDGNYGEKTVESVTTFQADHGMAADGQVGAQTWAVLGEAESAAGIHPHAAAEPDGNPAVGSLSEDQLWRWDGDQWQPELQEMPVAASDEQPGGHVSADGQWLWDGTKWEPVTG